MKKERSPRSVCPVAGEGPAPLGQQGHLGRGGGQGSLGSTVHGEPSRVSSTRSGARSLSPGPACPHPHLGMKCAVSSSATPWTVAHQALLSVGILQARILEWVEWVELVAMPASRGFSQTRDGTQVFPIAGGFITS